MALVIIEAVNSNDAKNKDQDTPIDYTRGHSNQQRGLSEIIFKIMDSRFCPLGAGWERQGVTMWYVQSLKRVARKKDLEKSILSHSFNLCFLNCSMHIQLTGFKLWGEKIHRVLILQVN